MHTSPLSDVVKSRDLIKFIILLLYQQQNWPFLLFFLYWARTVAGKKKRERLLVQLGAMPWFLFGCQQSYPLLLCVISANINQVKMAKNNLVVLWTPFLPYRSPGRVSETPKDLWTRPGDWIRADTWIQMKELEKLYLLFLFFNDFLMELSLKGY